MLTQSTLILEWRRAALVVPEEEGEELPSVDRFALAGELFLKTLQFGEALSGVLVTSVQEQSKGVPI